MDRISTRAKAFLFGLCLVTASVVGSRLAAEDPTAPEESAARPPNVVLIISDDQAWTDYGFMGHEHIRTPHLDRLAQESAFFPRGYVPTSLCRPSLATIATGLYPHQHRITGNDPAIPPSLRGKGGRRNPKYRQLCEQLSSSILRVPTLPRTLAKHGYRSHQSGKWWEGNHRLGGFTHGMTHGDPDRGGRHGDDGLRIGRKGLSEIKKFIDESGEKPFFLWYAPFLPHTPHNPPERLLAKYRIADRPPALAKYYAMCEWFDATCGELLSHLDARGLRDDTLVIYVTDNGWIQRTNESVLPKEWNQGFAPRSKQSPNEGGIRTPILLRWPGRIEPRRHDDLVSSIDIAPTVLAACGLPANDALPGMNLLDLLAGRAKTRKRLFGEIFAHDVADIERPAASILYRFVIEGRWKLITTEDGAIGRYRAIHPRTNRAPQLYDIEADPHEARDLAKTDPKRVAAMLEALDEWWKPEIPAAGN